MRQPSGVSATAPATIQRKPIPSRPDRKPPPIPLKGSSPIPQALGSSGPRPDVHRLVTPPGPPGSVPRPRFVPAMSDRRPSDDHEKFDRAKRIFKPLEDYMLDNYGRYECLNLSFGTARPCQTGRTLSEGSIKAPAPQIFNGPSEPIFDFSAGIDAKTLLLGDFAENGDWWTGRLERNYSEKMDKSSKKRGMVSSKSPNIDYEKMSRWYELVHGVGQSWWDQLDKLNTAQLPSIDEHIKGPRNSHEIDIDISIAREHSERALLKITENLLKRPGRPLKDPEDVRFLIMILSNPSLYPPNARKKARSDSARPRLDRAASSTSKMLVNAVPRSGAAMPPSPTKPILRDSGQHTGILKRVLGLLANSSDSCHRYMISWFSRMPEARYIDLLDLVSSFVTYRLSKRRSRQRSGSAPQDGGLIPDLSGSRMQMSAQLQAATGLSGGSKKKSEEDGVQSVADYSEDWQLKAAAKIMALLFAANNLWHNKDALLASANITESIRPRAKSHGQLLPTSDFYNTLLDYTDLIADFKAWESKKAKFTFCQYPFLLSLGSKIRILEYDARRQMENKAREAYFDNVTSGRSAEVNLNLLVRRECVVDDSLRQISAAVGAGQEELKKGLRVKFTGEEGIDAGGLRKEWFLMLVRDIFDPNHGMSCRWPID